jgi:hypothetical protein
MAMNTITRAFAIAALAPLLLTACGGGGKDPVVSTPPATTPPTNTAFQSKFGASFATAFNASATSDPIDPTASSVPAVNVMAQPEDN